MVGTYRNVMFRSDMTFVPSGLVEGSNTVFIRAVDSAGNQGPATPFTFVYDTTPPGSVTSLGATANGLVTFGPAVGALTYEYRVADSTIYVDLGTSRSFRLVSPSRRPQTVMVRARDAAGNAGPEQVVKVRPIGMRVFQNYLRAMHQRVRQARLTNPHRSRISIAQ
jgi:hypothetical protein